MNSKNTIYILASILALALIANVNSIGSIYATGGLDDEEEEEAIEELQNSVEELQNTLGTIELNLTEGANDIQANCPSTEEIVQEVVENITEGQEQEQNVTEPEQPTCPFAQPPVQNNVTEPEPEPVQPAVQQPTCPFAPVVPPVEQNVTEQIEEVIENVTNNQPTCDIPAEIIPDILPELNETEVIEEPVQNVTEPEQQEVPVCPFTGEPIQQQPAIPENNVTEPAPPIQDEQEIATIEFEASCGCFVVDKSAQEVE